MYHHNNGPIISKSEDELKKYIRDIHDFPINGIIFRDITNLLRNGEVFKNAIDQIVYRFSREEIDVVCSVEARGFILGSAVACALGAGFVPLRKKGKLPWNTHQKSYGLEYGEGELEIHTDAISSGQHVLFVDDVIATGGTVKAGIDLIREMKGSVICAAFLVELLELKGREKIIDVPIYALMQY